MPDDIAGTAASVATASGSLQAIIEGVAYGAAGGVGLLDGIIVSGVAAGAATCSGLLYNLVQISGVAHGVATVTGTRFNSEGAAHGAAVVTGTLTGLGFPFSYDYSQPSGFLYGYTE